MAFWPCECRPCARVPPACVARLATETSPSLCVYTIWQNGHMRCLVTCADPSRSDAVGALSSSMQRKKSMRCDSKDCTFSRRGRRSPERRDQVPLCIRDIKESTCHQYPVKGRVPSWEIDRMFLSRSALTMHQAIQCAEAHGETEPGYKFPCVCACCSCSISKASARHHTKLSGLLSWLQNRDRSGDE